jgi:Helix-turn-helix domain
MTITSCGLGHDKLGAASCGLGRDCLRALHTPRETETIVGISHASLYRLIGAGRLDARKIGSATRITAASIQALLDELPKVGPQG